MKKVFFAAMTAAVLISSNPLFAGRIIIDYQDPNQDPHAIHRQLNLTEEFLKKEGNEILALGVDAYKNKEFKAAIQLFEKIVETDVNAAIILGHMYRKGEGVDPNFPQARVYFRMGALQQNGVALFNLGCMANEGEGRESSPTQALIYFWKAVDVGHEPSKSMVSIINQKIEIQGGIAGTGKFLCPAPMRKSKKAKVKMEPKDVSFFEKN